MRVPRPGLEHRPNQSEVSLFSISKPIHSSPWLERQMETRQPLPKCLLEISKVNRHRESRDSMGVRLGNEVARFPALILSNIVKVKDSKLKFSYRSFSDLSWTKIK